MKTLSILDARNPLRVLTYHRIADPDETPDLDPALVSATPDAFRRQMEHVRKWYNPVDLAQVEAAFREGQPLPRRAVHVTVDDAYRDFGECAWPILRALDIPVTVFVPTAFPGEPARTLWWDRLHRAHARGLGNRRSKARGRDMRSALRELPHEEAALIVDRSLSEAGFDDMPESFHSRALLSWDELRTLAGEGVGLGVHTRHHAALARLDEPTVRDEIRRSLEDIEREIGAGPWPIAYPYGSYDETAVRIAREEGCTLGFTCDDGLNKPGIDDPLQLRRTNITPRTSPTVFRLRMLPWFAEIDRWRHRAERARWRR